MRKHEKGSSSGLFLQPFLYLPFPAPIKDPSPKPSLVHVRSQAMRTARGYSVDSKFLFSGMINPYPLPHVWYDLLESFLVLVPSRDLARCKPPDRTEKKKHGETAFTECSGLLATK